MYEKNTITKTLNADPYGVICNLTRPPFDTIKF